MSVVRPFVRYALAGAALVGALAGALALTLKPERAAAVGWAALVAYAVQLAAFGALLGSRGGSDAGGRGFFLAWGGGTLLRLGVVVAAGAWVLWSAPAAPAALLIGLVGTLFLLLLLEPVFFRMGLDEE